MPINLIRVRFKLLMKIGTVKIIRAMLSANLELLI
jgi:hypothetical protein